MEYEKISSVAKISLSEKVYRMLMESITNGSLPAGTELREQHLAKKMDVSATPVREALRRLASDGLVEMIPYHGAVVRTLNREEIREAYACREVLERLAVKECIAHLTKEDINALYRLVDDFKSAEGIYDIAETSQRFDEYIYQLSGNQTLCVLLEKLKGIIKRDKKYSSANAERRQEIFQEHIAIIDAMDRRNIKEAQEAVSRHIHNGYHYIENKSEKQS